MKLFRFSALVPLLLSIATVVAPSAEAQPTVDLTYTQSIVIDQNSSGTANPGDTLLYTVAAENTGDGPANNVVITISPDPNVEVVMGSLNVHPLAADDSLSTNENAVSPVSGNLLTNDAGLDAGEVMQVVSVAGSSTPGTVATTFGTITWASNGSVSYQVDAANPVVNGLGNGGILGDSITYTITDGTGFSDSSILLVSISGIEDAPIVMNDTFDVFNNNITTVDAPNGVLANDVDPELGPLTVTGFSPTSTNGATVNVNTDGSFTYTPLSITTGGTDTFTYTATDANSQSTGGTVTVIGFGRLLVVDNTGGPSGTGTFADPFNTLAAAFSANVARDTVYVRIGDGTNTGQSSNYAFGGDDMRLLGHGVPLVLNSTVIIPPNMNKPVVGALGVPTFALLNRSVEIRGLDIQCQGSGASAVDATYSSGIHSLVVTDTDLANCDAGFEIAVLNDGTNAALLFAVINAPSVNGPVVDLQANDASVTTLGVAGALLSGSSRSLRISADDTSSVISTVQDMIANMMSAANSLQINGNGASTIVMNLTSGNQVTNNTSGTGISALEAVGASVTLNMVPGTAPANSVSGNSVGICNNNGRATLNIVPGTQVNGNATNIDSGGCT